MPNNSQKNNLHWYLQAYVNLSLQKYKQADAITNTDRNSSVLYRLTCRTKKVELVCTGRFQPIIKKLVQVNQPLILFVSRLLFQEILNYIFLESRAAIPWFS